MIWRRSKQWQWRAAVLAGAPAIAAVMALPEQARAEGFLDFLFGGFQQRQAPPSDVNSYAEPPPPGFAPPPLGSESLRRGGGDGGRAMAYCVRLCDGQHFPMAHLANATPVETCRAMCPASKTKVYFGSAIDSAIDNAMARYADLDTAFVYRKQLVAHCTCNGKDAFGLAPFDLANDPTLRPGDIVATKDGFVAYRGKRGQADAFTPIPSSAVAAALIPGSSQRRLSRRAGPVPAADAPGAMAQPRAPPPVALTRQADRSPTTSSASDSAAVSPGDSMPNRLTNRGRPWAGGPAIMKSAAGSPGPLSFGLMPQ